MCIKGRGHCLTLAKGHADFKVKTCFSQEQLGDLGPKFVVVDVDVVVVFTSTVNI